MNGKKIQLYVDRDKTIEAVPETSADCVILSDGNNLQDVLDNDLTSPTVTHDTTAIKVGVGDSDVSSSVVDGEVGRMVIKGQTYQNILPEPTLRNEMQGKSMQRLNEGYDSIETVDGVSKSAILSGQTLVNLATKNTRHDGNATVTFTDTGHSIKIVFNGSGSRVVSFKLNQTLKSNTKYLFIAKCTKNFDTSPALSFFNGKSSFGMDLVTTSNKDKIIITTTDASLYTHVTFGLHGGMIEGNEFEVDYPVFIEYQEGMENWDIPYFEGMTSCKMPVLTTTGKNLWNNYSLERGSISHIHGVNLNQYTTETRSKDYIPIVPNTEYVATSYGFDGTTSSDLIRYYDSEKNFIGTSPNEKSTFLRTVFQMDVDNISHVQLEQGTLATPYEPYKSNILRTPEEVILKGLGDIQDTLNINTGEYVQRICEIVLDGNDNWYQWYMTDTLAGYKVDVGEKVIANGEILCDKFKTKPKNASYTSEPNACFLDNTHIAFLLYKADFPTINDFKDWLSQNPITVQYQLATEVIKTVDLSILDQNGGTQENLHSFANGHLQVSSEAENSLLPSVQYEIPTKNSYHMDLMKTNTLYTMKAKSVSGAFTIDSTSYNVNANGTFTSPSSMTDKLLIMSNKTNEEVMIIEGDVTSKTIPYFKGIKSAFEGEDKIEVLSTGKNLFDIDKCIPNRTINDSGVETESSASTHYAYEDFIQINDKFVMSITSDNGIVPNNANGTRLRFYDENRNLVNSVWFASHTHRESDGRKYAILSMDGAKYLKINFSASGGNADTTYEAMTTIQIEEGDIVTTYEPYKSNITKIPLLSPLRSLPDGVYDEIILDRERNKAQIIQRVGSLNPNGIENWSMQKDSITDYMLWSDKKIQCGKDRHFNNICNTFPVNFTYDRSKENCYVAYDNQLIFTPFTGRFEDVKGFKQWLSQNPTTVLYELNTPIITEVDLEGFPYIYKDGHIFLNSDIAPTTQITYSINQAQQIQANNETLQRHELNILDLDKLIVSFVNAEYNLRLLKFSMELSMMTLDK